MVTFPGGNKGLRQRIQRSLLLPSPTSPVSEPAEGKGPTWPGSGLEMVLERKVDSYPFTDSFMHPFAHTHSFIYPLVYSLCSHVVLPELGAGEGVHVTRVSALGGVELSIDR